MELYKCIIKFISSLKYDQDSVDSFVKISDLHKSSVRYCHFNNLGTSNINIYIVLVSCGADQKLGFIDQSGKIAHKIKNAH